MSIRGVGPIDLAVLGELLSDMCEKLISSTSLLFPPCISGGAVFLPSPFGYFVIVVSCEGDVVNCWVIGSRMNGAREV